MLEFVVERFNYAIVIILMMTGLYVVFSTGNLVKKLVGVVLFQTSMFLLYISVAKVAGGRPPVVDPYTGPADALYANPLPHVLILTAIVVGVSTLAVGLALVVRIREAYGSIEEQDLHRADLASDRV